MFSVTAHFERLEDVSIHKVYDELGVYVLWNAKALSRPTYIGEGNILRRFVEHLGKDWAHRPINGVIWVFDEARDFTYIEAKWVTESVEYGLFRVAEDIDCFPLHNKHPGRDSSVNNLLKRKKERTFRINFTGHDPLRPPENPPLRNSKRITFRDNDTYETDDWRRSPK